MDGENEYSNVVERERERGGGAAAAAAHPFAHSLGMQQIQRHIVLLREEY